MSCSFTLRITHGIISSVTPNSKMPLSLNLNIATWPSGATHAPNDASKDTLRNILRTSGGGSIIITSANWQGATIVGHGWYDYFIGVVFNYSYDVYRVRIAGGTVTYTQL